MTVTSGPSDAISQRTEIGGSPVDLGWLAARAIEGDTAARDSLLGHVRIVVHRYCRARLGRLPGSEQAADDKSCNRAQARPGHRPAFSGDRPLAGSNNTLNSLLGEHHQFLRIDSAPFFEEEGRDDSLAEPRVRNPENGSLRDRWMCCQ